MAGLAVMWCIITEMKKVKTHFFNGIRYNIIFGEIYGSTDTDRCPKDILITTQPNTRNELITIIHEGMHAGNWDKHEETIERSAKDIGRLLWRLGYRKRV